MPKSDVPGEHASPTQPFPTKPAPFAIQHFTVDDVNLLLLPDELAVMRERVRTAHNEGLFTPPSFKGTLSMPGHNGGTSRASTAVDPLNGELYVISKNLPGMLKVVLADEEPSVRGVLGGVLPPEETATALSAAKAAAAKGPVRYAVPYDFLLSPKTGLGANGRRGRRSRPTT